MVRNRAMVVFTTSHIGRNALIKKVIASVMTNIRPTNADRLLNNWNCFDIAMKIIYRKDELGGWLLTYCPRDVFQQIMVGSKACTQCEFFCSRDLNKRIVECLFNQI